MLGAPHRKELAGHLNRYKNTRQQPKPAGLAVRGHHSAAKRLRRGRAGSPAWLTTSHTLSSASLRASASTHTPATCRCTPPHQGHPHASH